MWAIKSKNSFILLGIRYVWCVKFDIWVKLLFLRAGRATLFVSDQLCRKFSKFPTTSTHLWQVGKMKRQRASRIYGTLWNLPKILGSILRIIWPICPPTIWIWRNVAWRNCFASPHLERRTSDPKVPVVNRKSIIEFCIKILYWLCNVFSDCFENFVSDLSEGWNGVTAWYFFT